MRIFVFWVQFIQKYDLKVKEDKVLDIYRYIPLAHNLLFQMTLQRSSALLILVMETYMPDVVFSLQVHSLQCMGYNLSKQTSPH